MRFVHYGGEPMFVNYVDGDEFNAEHLGYKVEGIPIGFQDHIQVTFSEYMDYIVDALLEEDEEEDKKFNDVKKYLNRKSIANRIS